MLIRMIYKAALMLIAFIGIVIQAESGLPFERSEEKKDVIINGITLSASQVSEFQTIYGIEPIPREYWYDRKSGLYGLVGQPAYSFLYAGQTDKGSCFLH